MGMPLVPFAASRKVERIHSESRLLASLRRLRKQARLLMHSEMFTSIKLRLPRIGRIMGALAIMAEIEYGNIRERQAGREGW